MGHDQTQEVAIEQSMLDAMYARLDSEIAQALQTRTSLLAVSVDSSQELYARDVEVARLTVLLSRLGKAEQSLCFGRVDLATGQSAHVGRIGLRDEDGQVLLVDWRADAARPFYAATPACPLGLHRRRHLRTDGRRVVAVSDELLDGSSPTPQDVVGDGPLTAALVRTRTGRMQEAVATLQAEQDSIVRSPHRGVTVVDGGPGTGKTIVALHRAAFVLYTFPRLAKGGVLMVGPNRRFLEYVSEVLPSLGENDVELATLADLTRVEPTATDSDAVALLKGQAGLAWALAQWVRRRQPSGVPLEFVVGNDTIVLEPQLVDAAQREATQEGLAHNPARAVFKDQVVSDLLALLEQRATEELFQMDAEAAELSGISLDEAVAHDLRSLGLDDDIATGCPEIDWEGIRRNLLEDPAIETAIDSVWPRLDATDALRRCLADPTTVNCDNVAFLIDGTWIAPDSTAHTQADLALLDECRALIDGPPRTYGHVVVDEAQELTEMQWRVLMRRCPTRSMTVVGDFAQAGSATTVRSWADALGPFVQDRFANHTLTINYRTTAEILDAASTLLRKIAPEQQTSHSIRRGEAPRTLPVRESTLASTLRKVLRQTSDTYADELIGVICPSARVPILASDLGETHAAVIAAPEVRGLEFDNVFIVDPDGIATSRPGGLRDLYVSSTRATKRLVILTVQTDSLPQREPGNHSTAVPRTE